MNNPPTILLVALFLIPAIAVAHQSIMHRVLMLCISPSHSVVKLRNPYCYMYMAHPTCNALSLPNIAIIICRLMTPSAYCACSYLFKGVSSQQFPYSALPIIRVHTVPVGSSQPQNMEWCTVHSPALDGVCRVAT